MAAIDEVVQRVRGGWLLNAPLDLAKAYVIDDQEIGASPALEAAGVGAVGEAGVEIVEEVDATGVAHADALLARAQGEGLEEVTLAGAVVAGDDEVVVPSHEVEAGELEYEVLVERRLEVPVERLESLALDESAGVDAPGDALFELVRCLDAEDVLEERGRPCALAGGPREVLVERLERAGQSEEVEVSSESSADGLVVAGAALSLGSGGFASLGHVWVSWVHDRAVDMGRRSYSVRSRGTVRA